MSARKVASNPLDVRGHKHPNSTPRLALRREDAAIALGISDESFDRYVRSSLPVVRVGSLRLYPVSALQRWLDDRAEAPIEGA
jgi:hypothetical protein